MTDGRMRLGRACMGAYSTGVRLARRFRVPFAGMSFQQRMKRLARRALQPVRGAGLTTAVRNRLMSAATRLQIRRDSGLWPRRPEAINFEITSICDAKCIHCPREEMDRRMKPMDLALFRKMV